MLIALTVLCFLFHYPIYFFRLNQIFAVMKPSLICTYQAHVAQPNVHRMQTGFEKIILITL